MRDANDYLGADIGLPPAERALLPHHWRATQPLEDALKAGMAPRSTAVEAVVNHGRWIVPCPDCPGAQLTAPEDRRFMCVNCGNASIGGKWRPVRWPKRHEDIEALLAVRIEKLANWSPGETVADLRAENELLASGAALVGGDA